MKIEKIKEVKKRKNKDKNPDSTGETVIIHRKILQDIKEVSGVPVCQSYKYLGTWMDSKLSCNSQVNYIKKKAAHLYSKLYPYLSSASVEGRRDMFMTLVMPLFNSALILLNAEPSKTQQINVRRVCRGIFKQFLLISKRTNSILVEDMMRKDLDLMAKEEAIINEQKWQCRKDRIEYRGNIKKRPLNSLRGVPANWSELINSVTKQCPKCKHLKKVTNRWHLKYYHGIELPHINGIWRRNICPVTVGTNEEDDLRCSTKPSRKKIRAELEPVIKKHLDDYLSAIIKLNDTGRTIQ